LKSTRPEDAGAVVNNSSSRSESSDSVTSCSKGCDNHICNIKVVPVSCGHIAAGGRHAGAICADWRDGAGFIERGAAGSI